MSFAALTPTADLFEVVRMVLVAVALVVTGYNLREAWGEMDWALDDRDATMRRLGPSRYANAMFLLVAVLFLGLGAATSLLVPSALQDQATMGLETVGVVVDAINQRVATIGALVFVTLMGVNDAWWRQDADRRRREAPRPSLTPPPAPGPPPTGGGG